MKRTLLCLVVTVLIPGHAAASGIDDFVGNWVNTSDSQVMIRSVVIKKDPVNVLDVTVKASHVTGQNVWSTSVHGRDFGLPIEKSAGYIVAQADWFGSKYSGYATIIIRRPSAGGVMQILTIIGIPGHQTHLPVNTETMPARVETFKKAQ